MYFLHFLSRCRTEIFCQVEVCVLLPIRTTGPTWDSANQTTAFRSTCVQRRFSLSPVQLLGHSGFSWRSDSPVWPLSHLPCSSQPCLATWFLGSFCLFLLLAWFSVIVVGTSGAAPTLRIILICFSGWLLIWVFHQSEKLCLESCCCCYSESCPLVCVQVNFRTQRWSHSEFVTQQFSLEMNWEDCPS